jgi:hypothetical protein
MRFESWTIVNALVQGDYVEQGPANVVTITAKGKSTCRRTLTGVACSRL